MGLGAHQMALMVCHTLQAGDSKVLLLVNLKGDRHDNNSNVYRLCASIKVGECVDTSSGFKFEQVR